jgi:hypothetical protein
VLSSACSRHPLVCEGRGQRAASKGLGPIRQPGPELIQARRYLPQHIAILRLCLEHLVLLWRSSGTGSSSRRVARCERRWLITSARQRHVGVSRHKVTMLWRVVGSRPTGLGQEINRLCVFQTHRAGNLHRRSKKTFTRHPPDTLRSHLSCIIKCEWCSPIDGATDASAG